MRGTRLVGREHDAEHRDDRVEVGGFNRQILGVAFDEHDVETFGGRAFPRVDEQLRHVVDADDARATTGCRNRGVAAAACDVEHLPAGTQVRRFCEVLGDEMDAVADGGVVAARPRLLLHTLDRFEIGLGCSHVISSDGLNLQSPCAGREPGTSAKAVPPRRRVAAPATGRHRRKVPGQRPCTLSTVSVLVVPLPRPENREMQSYGEYCPIAVGVEVFADRWTPLVLRELMIGCCRFNEIHRGLPKMNRTLLVQRLRSLERRGLVERHAEQYRLTEAGRELEPIVWALGQWAARWAFGDPLDNQLDASWLVWRLHQHVVESKIPEGRTVVEFVVTGTGGGNAWLVLDRGSSTACQIDPGYDVDLVVHGDSRALHKWLLGVASTRELLKNGSVRFIGPSRLSRAFPTWFDNSMFDEGLSARRGKPRMVSAVS